MKHPRLLAVASVLVAFALPATASAQDVAPPGNSAVDQYRESAPPPSSGSRKVSRSQREALERRGADGAALAAALDRSGGVPTPESGETGSGTAAAGGGAGSGARGGGAGEGAKSSSSGRSADTAGDTSAGSSDGVTPSTDPKDESTSKAAAASTVGGLPVWALLAGAVVVVAGGLVLRRRSTV